MSQGENQAPRESVWEIVYDLRSRLFSLETEFKYFRNIMVTLYLTVVAPLLVIVIQNNFGGK